MRWIVVICGCAVSAALAGSPLAAGSGVIAANGVQVVVPGGWHLVPVAGNAGVIDPLTVLVVGTKGVRPRPVACPIVAYRIPPGAAAIVVVRWRTETSGGGRPPRSRAPLRHIVLNRLGFDCWPNHLGGAAELALGGHAYQVNVLIGDGASARRVHEALAVARSFDLKRR